MGLKNKTALVTGSTGGVARRMDGGWTAQSAIGK